MVDPRLLGRVLYASEPDRLLERVLYASEPDRYQYRLSDAGREVSALLSC